MRLAGSMVAVWLALYAAGCGSNPPGAGTAKEEAAADARPTAVVDEANGGTIAGRVAFTGPKPERKVLSMDSTPKCAEQHKEPVLSEDAIINPNGTVKNAFVWVKAGLPEARWPMPAAAVQIDQRGCVYVPHVVGVRVGQDVEFLNSDPTNHNIHPMPRANREWNESQPPLGEKKVKQFSKQEVMVPIKCNVHPWMKVWIGVVDHPFFAVTGDDGSFTLKGLPPGEYTVEVWHERFGAQEARVSVGAGETKTADFTLKG